MTAKTTPMEGTDVDHESLDEAEISRYEGMTLLRVTIGGSSPMLQHRVPPETLMKIWNKEKASKNAANPEPKDQALIHLYRDEVNDPECKVPVLPLDNLFASLRAAGRFVRLQGKSMVSTRKDTQLPGLMGLVSYVPKVAGLDAATQGIVDGVCGAYLPLLHRVKGTLAGWQTDIRPARNQTGELVVAIRPRFDSWSLRLRIWVDQGEFPIEKARQIFDIAGSRIGVGSFRPEKKGTYGRFQVDEWKVLTGPGKA